MPDPLGVFTANQSEDHSQQQAITGTPAEQNEQRKRRKVAQACDLCRSRKSRCDGVKPVCGECAQRPNLRSQCRYTPNPNRVPDHDGYVSGLLLRIRELEARECNNDHLSSLRARIQELESLERARGLVNADPASPQDIGGRAEPRAPMVAESALRAVPLAYSTEQRPASEPSSVDAMGADGFEFVERGQDNSFYGGSSAVSFMHQVHATIAGQVPMLNVEPVALLNTSATSSASHTRTSSKQAYLSLPPRAIVDKVMITYWEKVHHLYPFVNRMVFGKAYDNIWVPEAARKDLALSDVGMLGSRSCGQDDIVFHCALNSMLALGVQFMDLPSDERTTLGDIFADKARSLCQLDLFDNGSLAMVQSLLLMAQYLQSTPFPSRCWNCIGIACRLAQGLGLHVEPKEVHQTFTALDLEMRRRVWHGCVMLDAIVSMTLGRPQMLRESLLLPYPRNMNDKDMTYLPEHHPSWLNFYNESIKLYRILADVMSQIYGHSTGQSEQNSKDSFDITLDIDAQITRFEAQVPDHLHWKKEVTSHLGAQVAQQACILQIRRTHLRILLYRPIFVRFCDHVCKQGSKQPVAGPSSSTSSIDISLSIIQSLAQACVVQSVQLIDTIHQSLTCDTAGAWWYSAFYARAAGTIVLLAILCDALSEGTGTDGLKAAWEQCDSVFQLLRGYSPAVATQHQGLRTLYHRICIVEHKHKHRGSSPVAIHVDASTSAPEHSFDLADNISEAAFASTDDFYWPIGADFTLINDVLGINA
ncbi:hypothetical protein AUEXF2481DRAFT_345350 [Aureobasidium subglaciale EXF-2481]|uniref:Zn(2)-C6 fungal-type domain-containing protein n=1 Tax=Aureobasidium subglaciale (strain EXF-2481) TaxID=1043005 RepID=A0A074Y5I9_AURSE|nr:uncharacterized protein AUEXF2481DRAFT_345350 [Aureobasidium subglaciale EXF-2481]KEQ92995.1 hypothetical protein AUEXF2481DRAFT_345350 [Aureobasidium subglaciale EXF-2481]